MRDHKSNLENRHYDWDYLVQKDKVHRVIYTDENIFRAEMQKI